MRISQRVGLWLTIFGYAGMGAAAAYLGATDLHGHLYQQCALQAAGAAVLGGIGWSFSERLAHAVNLNTSPFMRLLLSGIAAVFAAAWGAGPYTEFAAGAEAWWPQVAAVAVYVVAGVLPLAGSLALLAGLETLGAARRGNAAAGEAARLAGRSLALGIALVCAVVASGIYLRPQLRDAVVALTPERVRTSNWIEREKRLFSHVLERSNCEVLVAPVDVTEAADSLDRPARSLIARYVAAHIATQSGLCVADPSLVARALGASARQHPLDRTLALASAVGARWVVAGSVALSEDRRTFEVTIDTFTRQGAADARWDGAQATAWGPLAFSDELPPEQAFAAIAPQVAGHISLPAQSATRTAATDAIPALPESPIGLAEDPGSPLARAQRLQLLAAAHRAGDVAGEHLWERSVIALGDLPAADEGARVLRARAALHLHRRPYAMALLRGLDSAQSLSLAALAQGNLPQAIQSAREIKEPTAALIAQLELERLRDAYLETSGQSERRLALFAAAPKYAALFGVAMSSPSEALRDPQERIFENLRALGAPVADDPQDTARRLAYLLTLKSLPAAESVRLGSAIERAYAKAWRARAAAWRLQPASDRLAQWDVHEALYAANRAAVIGVAQSVHAKQGALALLDLHAALDPLFGGYPALAVEAAGALRDLAASELATPDSLLSKRASGLMRDVAVWEGGQTEVTRALPDATNVADDELPRAWTAAGKSGEAPVPAAASLAQRQLDARRAVRLLAYAQTDFGAFERAHALLRGADMAADADRLLALNRDRFIGHPARDRFLLRLARERDDFATQTALLDDRMREHPQDWKARLQLARIHLELRQFQQAQHTLLGDPLLAAKAEGAALASAQAAEGGELLLWAGEPQLARALFDKAGRALPGSPGALWGGVRSAQIEGRWAEARERATQMHELVQAPAALATAAEISFLLNEPEAGWRAFYEAAKRFENIGPWNAALAAHRMAQTKYQDLVAFAKRWKSLTGDNERDTAIKSSFLFNLLLVDRRTDADMLAAFDSIAERAADKAYARLGAGYYAFKRASFAQAADELQTLLQGSPTRARYALPYLTASLMWSSRAEQAQALIAGAQEDRQSFHQLLARGYARGLAGDLAGASMALWQAQIALAGLEPQPVPPTFQLLEACEKLYESTRDDRYRLLLLDLARRQQQAWPFAWGYAVEAKHSREARERLRALAIALYLDPQSEHLAGFDEDARMEAAEWFLGNNPFRK